ncbi:TIGR01777 family oxidoreductase [Nocardioides stalactiti]|uniref:TIGR01777 family oxidoreductase n=1 Tax=Nocardioides stalactiti TaxID=2755356 RepID=UPI00160284FB|nr:TIGR01777 family oxidoreductase [Nocardioides stalactiti]
MGEMSIVMAGSSGFLGTHLRSELERRGHRVTALVRRPTSLPDESTWDPAVGEVDAELIAAADVVVNLAGSPTLGNPHSKKWSTELRDSRVQTTETLARAVAAAPAPPYLVAGNAVAWSGDHGGALLTEAADTRGHTLMTEVCRVWQAAAQPAIDAGGRVVFLRTSPVMDRSSAPLQQLRLLFKGGLGGKLGNGRQHMPMISLRDWVGAAAFLVEHPTASGPVNMTCVETPTNAAFTKALAAALNRPSFAAVPAPLLKVATGRVSPELLGSVNTRPQALLDLGYAFADPDVEAVVATGLAASASTLEA